LKTCSEGGDEPYYSTITKAEIYAGIRPGEEEKIAMFFGLPNAYLLTNEVAERAGCLILKFRDSQGLELPDAIVAATSIELGCELATRNKKL
jgi:predicted nucleic acid-binding protein